MSGPRHDPPQPPRIGWVVTPTVSTQAEQIARELLSKMRALRSDEERAAELVPWRPFGKPALDALRRGVAKELAAERRRTEERFLAVADRLERDAQTIAGAGMKSGGLYAEAAEMIRQAAEEPSA